jgi:suppressor of ftsI
MRSTFPTIIAAAIVLTACSPRGTMNHSMNGMQHGGEMMGNHQNGMMQASFLPGSGRDITDLPEAKPSSILAVRDGDTITLNPEIVRTTINGKSFAAYAYNGQLPGPTLKVAQGSTFTVRVTNNIDVPTTIHWHGIRLENRFDGAAGLTQEAIEPGESFSYTVKVPDEGMFWYHPHVREDLQQDMGLYANLWVTPKDEDAYEDVDREEILMLDDLYLEAGLPVPYGMEEADHALMGRFGNTMLVNGKTQYALSIPRGSVVRYYLTNAANARSFNVRFGTAKMKLIGGDAGRKEREELVNSIILSPSERAIVDVYFADAGTYRIESVSPVKTWLLGTVTAAAGQTQEDGFAGLNEHADVMADIDTVRPFFGKPVDKTIRLSVESAMAGMMQQGGMDHGAMQHGTPTSDDGIEWEDPMQHMNAMSVKGNTQWKLIDAETGKENMEINYQFKVGDKVKIRIVNETEGDGSDHPMQHPIHFHGQRFVVLAVDGEENENLVWKDTTLVPAGKTVDILLDITNPGDWMFHCHIAEHLSNGMMGRFTVRE